MDVRLGSSLATLGGPWAFQTGDNPDWAKADFDDGAWERVGLDAPPTAHDGDVGIPHYVPGWAARGHPGYSGFAWYRLPVSVTGTGPEDRLSLVGPAAVDSAYQLYVDTVLIGGQGDFTASTPTAKSIQPHSFPLPAGIADGQPHVIAIRVWLDPALGAGRDVGGMHVAPILAGTAMAEDQVRLQWLRVVEGYIVDAVEPFFFLMLAVMAALLTKRGAKRPALLTLAAALIVMAALRANQILLFWTQLESLHLYDLLRSVLLTPLTLGLWTMVWARWFGTVDKRTMTRLCAGFTLALMIVQLGSRAWFAPSLLHDAKHTLHSVASGLRWGFVVLYVWCVSRSCIGARSVRGMILPMSAALLASIGLFADELSAIGVPGIWFPFGVGVSRTQYAYAGLIVVLFALLMDLAARRSPDIGD